MMIKTTRRGQLTAGSLFVVCLVSLICSALPVSRNGGQVIAQPQSTSRRTPLFSQERGGLWIENVRNTLFPKFILGQDNAQTRRYRDFEKGRNLLVARNVPFDPEILLTDNWRKTLKPTFDQMPELQEVRRGTNHLKGVQMAHTLYLPEKVSLEGDTVILVRNLIFDGREAVIRGPFNIYVYPVDEAGLLGTSYESALARARPKTGVRFITAAWTGNRALPVMPIITGGTIKINTSGLGRADWLESQRAMAGGGGRMIKAGFFQQGENHNGHYGGDGDWGLEGA